MPHEPFRVLYLPVSGCVSDVQTKRFYVYRNGVPESTSKETCAQINERNVVRALVATLRKMTDRSSLRNPCFVFVIPGCCIGIQFRIFRKLYARSRANTIRKTGHDGWPHCRPGHGDSR